MSTANEVELLLITISLTTLCTVVIVLIIQSLLVVRYIKRLATKAEAVINNVESAAETLANMSRASKSRFPIISLIHDLMNKGKADK